MKLTADDGTVYEIPDDFAASYKREWLPPDLDDLVGRGLLSAAEAKLLAKARDNDRPPASTEVYLRAVPDEPEAPEPPKPQVPPCSRNRGGSHVFVKHALMENGEIRGWCSCGYTQQPAPCPHKQQLLAGKNVTCAWCHKVIIRNTGYDARTNVEPMGNDAAREVDVNKYQGDA